MKQTQASEVYEVVVEARGLAGRLWSWFRTLFVAVLTFGGGGPSLDLSRAKVVRRSDGTVVRWIDNKGTNGEDHVATVAADVDRLTVEAFEHAWLFASVTGQPS